MEIKEVSIVGAGKVGSAFAEELAGRGFRIGSVISSSHKSAHKLASRVGAIAADGYAVPSTTSLVIISVPDNQLEKVAGAIRAGGETIVVHTAGSFGLEVFPEGCNFRTGVIYPLQTFSLGRAVDLSKVPMLIEGDSSETERILVRLAASLSATVSVIDSEKRRSIHLAAVFACNFVNYMLGAAEDISLRSGVDFRLFESLVKKTIEKAFELGPSLSQTGPAARNDNITIEKHLDLLSYSPQLKEVYERVTRLIIDKQRKKGDE